MHGLMCSDLWVCGIIAFMYSVQVVLHVQAKLWVHTATFCRPPFFFTSFLARDKAPELHCVHESR